MKGGHRDLFRNNPHAVITPLIFPQQGCIRTFCPLALSTISGRAHPFSGTSISDNKRSK